MHDSIESRIVLQEYRKKLANESGFRELYNRATIERMKYASTPGNGIQISNPGPVPENVKPPGFIKRVIGGAMNLAPMAFMAKDAVKMAAPYAVKAMGSIAKMPKMGNIGIPDMGYGTATKLRNFQQLPPINHQSFRMVGGSNVAHKAGHKGVSGEVKKSIAPDVVGKKPAEPKV